MFYVAFYILMANKILNNENNTNIPKLIAVFPLGIFLVSLNGYFITRNIVL